MIRGHLCSRLEGTKMPFFFPNELIPYCPKCGEEMNLWGRPWNFLEGEEYRASWQREVDSIYNNKEDMQTVNTLNNGAIPELPVDAIIEVNSVITKDGPKTIAVGKLPSAVKGIILQMENFEELVVQAAITGSYHDAYLAFVANPLLTDEKQSKVILDEMLIAHQQYLPQFKDVINTL